MNGVHVIWSVPRGNKPFKSKYEFLTALLSALEWRKNNGSVILFTDCCDEFSDFKGLVWNEIRDIGHINVNHEIFWAAAKIYAMKQLKPPFCMIDTDFIVWKKLDFNDKLCAIHEEETDIYPDYPEFLKANGFSKKVKPVNTAFTYINDEEFLDMYADKATGFMENYSGDTDFLKPMIFAEQRMFSMCAEKLGIKINILSSFEKLFKNGDNGYFTHLWGFKSQMDNDITLKKSFEKKLENRIRKEFPEVYAKIKEVI